MTYSYQDHLYDQRYDIPPRVFERGDRLSHLVFVDGRLVDAWTEDVRDTRYESIALEYDEARRPQVVQSPPPPPRHVRVLQWLDSVAGGRGPLVAMTDDPGPGVLLSDVLEPVADEPWLIADEVPADGREALLPLALAVPLRRCLLLLRDRVPELPERMNPVSIAAGVVWVVGKANAAIGPEGPVTQVSVAEHLDVTSLNACGNRVLGHVRRLGWATDRPWGTGCPPLFPTGRVELLSEQVRADLVQLRDDALAEQAVFLPPEVESCAWPR